jgi:phosphate transport system protein
MSHHFDEQLKHLDNLLIEMGGWIEYVISFTIQALVKQDAELARKIIVNAREINIKEKEIEDLCLKLLLQQPVAGDLRQISSTLKMITDMERIGDQCGGICELTILLADEKYLMDLIYIPKMAEVATKMVKEAIDAFIKKDLEIAKSVVLEDDIVDEHYEMVRNDIVTLIRQDAANADQAIDFMQIAKYLERIGDHAVNIAEWVGYSITGVHKSLEIN